MNNREKFLLSEVILQSVKDGIDNETLKIISDSKLNADIKLECMAYLKYLNNDLLQEILENIDNGYPIRHLIWAIKRGVKEEYIKPLLKINSIRIICNVVTAYESGMDDIKIKTLLTYSNENSSDEFLWRWRYKKIVNHYDEIKNWDMWSRNFIEKKALKDNIDEKILDIAVSLFDNYDTDKMREYILAYEDGIDQENLNKLAKIEDSTTMREFRIAVKNNMDDKNLNILSSLSGEKAVQFMRAYNLNMDEKNLETLSKLPEWNNMRIFVEAFDQNVEQECLDILSEINDSYFMGKILYNIRREGMNKDELKQAKNIIDNSTDPKDIEEKLYNFFQECKMNKNLDKINQYIKDNNLDVDINTIKELLKI